VIVPDHKLVVGVGLNAVVHGGCLYFQWALDRMGGVYVHTLRRSSH